MPTLLDTIEIKEMAFAWDATTRVYRTDRLRVLSEEDKEDWKFSSGSWGQNVEGIWLFFQVESNYHQRISPQSSAGNDWIDIKNAIIDSTKTVTFYPIYSVDNTISYPVISNENGRHKLLETDRALFKPSIALNIKPVDRLASYPTWLRTTRYKP